MAGYSKARPATMSGREGAQLKTAKHESVFSVKVSTKSITCGFIPRSDMAPASAHQIVSSLVPTRIFEFLAPEVPLFREPLPVAGVVGIEPVVSWG